jgi:hypothetical protein
MTRLKVRISSDIASFAQISPKQALKYTIFFNTQKRGKWPNHFISGKPFRKGQTAPMVRGHLKIS